MNNLWWNEGKFQSLRQRQMPGICCFEDKIKCYLCTDIYMLAIYVYCALYIRIGTM